MLKLTYIYNMAKVKKKLIVVVAMPGIFLLDIAGPCDVFAAADKLLNGNGGYDVLLASPINVKKISTKSGVEVNCSVTVNTINRPIDTVIIAGFSWPLLENGDRFFQWLKGVYPKVNRIASI